MPGDEVRLRYAGKDLNWQAVGHVVKFTQSTGFISNRKVWSPSWNFKFGVIFASHSIETYISSDFLLFFHSLDEEVAIELRHHQGPTTDATFPFSVDFVWKSTSFDRYILIKHYTYHLPCYGACHTKSM